MTRSIWLLTTFLTAPALAQTANLTVKPTEGQTTRITIETKITTEEDRQILINGEEGGFGGFGGFGGGEMSLSQKIVFDEGSNWRQYHTVEATQLSPDRDGEIRESKVEGGLTGKKVFVKANPDGDTVLTEGTGEDAEELSRSLANGVPAKIDLSGLLPAKEVAVGEEFALDASFVEALTSLAHPVNADAATRRGRGGEQGGGRGGRGGEQGGGRGGRGGEQGGGRGGRGGEQGGGRGGRGGEQGGGRGGRGGEQGGGRGGRGGEQGGGRGNRFGRSGRTRTPSSIVSQLIGGGKLQGDLTGTLISVNEGTAVIDISGTLSGKGSNEELGLPRGRSMWGGRGGRGGRGGQDSGNSSNAVDAAMDINGQISIDLASSQISDLRIKGKVVVAQTTNMTREGRDGEEMKIESNNDTKGKFEVKLHCEPADSK